jgi:hypothetical protein
MRTAQVNLTERRPEFSGCGTGFPPLDSDGGSRLVLIACCNIANLLARAATGNRRASGAGRGQRRLVRHCSPSLLLALMAGALGVLIAWWGGSLLVSMVGGRISALDVGPNLVRSVRSGSRC